MPPKKSRSAVKEESVDVEEEKKKRSMIDEYLDYQTEYEKEYGKKTIVLYENGHFYECYGIDNEEEVVGDLKTVSDILNIQLTRKNKKIIENNRGNPLLIGIPAHTNSLNKYLPLLIENGYTVVFVEQITKPPNPDRAVTRVISPGTYMGIDDSASNNLLSIYIERDQNVMYGMSAVDLTTGKNTVYEMNAQLSSHMVMDECYRFIESFQPKEIIIYANPLIDRVALEKTLELYTKVHHYVTIDTKLYSKLSYQNEFLAKIFPDHGLLSPIEYVDLECKPYALMSYMMCLDFIYRHDPNILRRIEKPDHWTDNKYMVLNGNSLYQLNIVDNNAIETHSYINSLYSVLNKTSTVMGKRLLKTQLLNPIIDQEELEARYAMIAQMIEGDLYKKVREVLVGISDTERAMRQIQTKMIEPHQLANRYRSYLRINTLFELVEEEMPEMHEEYSEVINQFRNFIEEMENYFDIDELSKYNMNKIETSFFKEDIYEEVDKVSNLVNNAHNFFGKKAEYYSNLIESGKTDLVKVETSDSHGMILTMTNARSNRLYPKLPKKEQDSTVFEKKTATTVKVISVEISRANFELLKNSFEIQKVVKKYYLETLDKLSDGYSDCLLAVNNFIAMLDVACCGAKCAVKYGYCRPEISLEDHSYVDCEGLRHPIIERVQTDVIYVPNDVKLDRDGIMLFGINGGGKSSLLKAVGLSVVMAQAGLYVPATSFVYSPFKRLYTRIMGIDNLFKGQSSFKVEMDELKAIVTSSDSQSLVLGDEICRGTEVISAISIVASVVKMLVEKGINFLFATHLHAVLETPCIQALTNLRCQHLSVEISSDEDDSIQYGRKLVDGSGSTMYGLDVARHIIDDHEFIRVASETQKFLLNLEDNILNPKTSSYNADVYVHECAICGKTEKEVGKGNLDVHHINMQSCANEKGMIGHIHKNVKANLVVLCEEHHNEVHHGDLVINGYVQTTRGLKLDYSNG